MALQLDRESMNQLIELIDERIQEKLEEILGDPDTGLELTDQAKQKIEEALTEYKGSSKGTSVEDLAKEIGIELELVTGFASVTLPLTQSGILTKKLPHEY